MFGSMRLILQMKLVNRHIDSIEAQRRKNLRSLLSHELRTPLAIIDGYAQSLRQELNGEHASLVQPILQYSARLGAVITSILEYESPTTASELEATDCTITSVIQNSVDRLRPVAELNGNRLEFVYGDANWEVHSFTQLIESACMHLIENAIKFTNNGLVSVKVKAVDDTFVVIVEDTGIGIGEGNEDLFAPFVQRSTGLNRQYDGLGLGLHLCAQAAELLRGHVTLENRAEKGAIATLVLARSVAMSVKRVA